MVYVDPLKLEAHQLSPMDVVRSVNDNNLILPAGESRIGPLDYSLYTNSQVETVDHINRSRCKLIGRHGYGGRHRRREGCAADSEQHRARGWPASVYLPVLKQGGDTNTISVVDGIGTRSAGSGGCARSSLSAKVVFDQSVYVKNAIETLLHEGSLGLLMTAIMILMFLGEFPRDGGGLPVDSSLRARDFHRDFARRRDDRHDDPRRACAGVFARHRQFGGGAREHLPAIWNWVSACGRGRSGGQEVALPVLAATLTTAVVFFPVTFLYGVSKFLFTALALAVILALIASYFVAMTVVPLFCARFIRVEHQASGRPRGLFERFNAGFNRRIREPAEWLHRAVNRALNRPVTVLAGVRVLFAASLASVSAAGRRVLSRTDAGQFVINVKAPTGTRLENTPTRSRKVENSSGRRCFVERSRHDRVQHRRHAGVFVDLYQQFGTAHRIRAGRSERGPQDRQLRVHGSGAAQARDGDPHLTTYFQSGGLVDAVLNLGLPAPIDVQVSGTNWRPVIEVARKLGGEIRQIPGCERCLYPAGSGLPGAASSISTDCARASSGSRSGKW